MVHYSVPNVLSTDSRQSSSTRCVAKTVLILLLAVLLMVAASLLILKLKDNSDHICLEPICVEVSNTILKSIDNSTQPCDDFYQFACGNFNKNNILPNGASYVGVFSSMQVQMTRQMLTLLEEPLKPNDLPPFKMVKNLYRACMNEGLIENRGLVPLLNIIKRLGGWPLLEGEDWNEPSEAWTKLVNNMRREGFDFDHIIALEVRQDYYNSEKSAIYLQLPDLYRMDIRYILEIAMLYGANQTYAKTDIIASFAFHKELQKIRGTPSKYLTRMPLSLIQSKYPYIQWNEYLNDLLTNKTQIEQNEDIYVKKSPFYEQLGDLMNRTPKRTVFNYLIGRLVEYSSPYMTKSLRKIEASHKGLRSQTRSGQCLTVVSESMSIPFNAMYARKYLQQTSRTQIVDLVNRIQKELREIISNTMWMDDETRSSALRKLDFMGRSIGYPVEMMDDDKIVKFAAGLKIDEQKFLESILQINIHSVDRMLDELHKPYNKSDWTKLSHITMINAFYSPNKNAIRVPAAILQGFFYSAERPNYLNFATIGTIIGHELTHGFDTRGSKYDEHGDYKNWWNAASRNNFLERTKCMIQQYENFTETTTMLKVNGTLTQGENIADNGGIKESYRAYTRWANENPKEPQLPGLNYSPQQMFWIAFVQVWCSYSTEDSIAAKIFRDPHSPNQFRVLGSVMNSPYFANDFDCPVGSPMNQENKCEVW